VISSSETSGSLQTARHYNQEIVRTTVLTDQILWLSWKVKTMECKFGPLKSTSHTLSEGRFLSKLFLLYNEDASVPEIMLYDTILHYTTRHYTVPYYTMLSLLYYTILYTTVIYYTIPYYTNIQYCTVVYFIMHYYTMYVIHFTRVKYSIVYCKIL
jgi:hypothetical protein